MVHKYLLIQETSSLSSEGVQFVSFERRNTKVMSLISKSFRRRICLCEILYFGSSSYSSLSRSSISGGCGSGFNSRSSCLVHMTLLVNIVRRDMLTTETTHYLIFFELLRILIDKLGPLLGFMLSQLIEFILEIVILLLELLTQLPYNFILELDHLPQILIVINEHPSF
jgi:hypothetical protein